MLTKFSPVKLGVLVFPTFWVPCVSCHALTSRHPAWAIYLSMRTPLNWSETLTTNLICEVA
jgi:hypothetical protein